MSLQHAFWIGLAVWLLGGLIGKLSNNGVIHDVSVNIFGSITIVLGAFLFGRWLLRKMKGDARPETSPVVDGLAIDPTTGAGVEEGMRIYSSYNVPEEARDIIERAIQNDMFKPKGKSQDGQELLYVATPAQDWLAVVEVTDAILISAAYKTTAETVDGQVAEYLSA